MQETPNCHYDYANKCDCSEDDKCGCDFPNNMSHDYSSECNMENVKTLPQNKDLFNNTHINNQSISPNTAVIGRTAPDFTAPAILSDNTMIEHFNLYKYAKNHITVLFFYPEDFTFTCPSELIMLNNELNAFNKRNAKVLGISTDSIFSHLSWKELPPEKDGIADISFPLIADLEKNISKAYGILNQKETAGRATFILDKAQIIRHISVNDYNIWRNPTEILRIIDIINQQTNDITACPTGWKQNFPFERPVPENITEIYTRQN